MVSKKTSSFIIAAVVVIAGLTAGSLLAIKVHDNHNKAASVSMRQNEVSYKGVNGQTALALLKDHYKVSTKTYSGLGEEVVSINGVISTSKNYWAFIVNGKMAQVGAGSYTTKNSDTITWKLESI